MTDAPSAMQRVASHRQTMRRHLVLLVLLIIGSGVLRAFLSWPSVFAEDYISFLETDAWYHMRLVDALVADFPWRLWHDPYLSHPVGEPVNAGPVFDWLIAAVALVIGRGSPTSWQVDMVGVLTPPVLGALTLVPVYVLGRDIWSSHAGLWAAFMVAVLPSQMLDRSLLGFTDHHCLETLMSTTMMMCVVRALKSDAAASKRWALYAGVAFGTYLLTWGGAVLFVAFIVAWAGLQLVADAVRSADSDDVTRIIGPMLLVAAVMVAPWGRTRPYFAYQFAALVGGTIAIWAMHGVQRVGRRLGWGPVQWLATIAAVTGMAAVAALVVLGDNKANLLADASRISPFRRSGFVSEARPLMRSDLWYPLPLWREFTMAVPLAMMGLGVWVREYFEGPRAPWMGLLGIWTLTMIGATFGQVRFTYYLGVNVALFAALSCVRLLEGFDQGRLHALRPAAILAVAIAIAAPGVPGLLEKRQPTAVLNPNWQDALSWLRNNTPEPFSTPDAYLHPPLEGTRSAYSVMAWWDYGYWITRVAQRVPVSNPKQTGVANATGVLLAATPQDANRVMDRVGARYLIVNWQLQASPDGRASGSFFGGIVVAAGGDPADYCEMYAARDPATQRFGEQVMYCYPSYYRTMAMRLYLFGGQAAMPPGPVAVVASRRGRDGDVVVREIIGEWTFDTYEAASAYVKDNAGRSDLRVVSKTPQATCVPLEAVEGYRQVFRSLDQERGTGPHAVQIFEYAPQSRPRI